jgi:hypothetical protein
MHCFGLYSSSFQVDVVFMLAVCKGWRKDDKEEEDHDTEHLEGLLHFWWEHLSSESLVTCLGETLPLLHPFARNIHQERMEMIQALDDAMFEKIVEYDIRVPNSRYAQSIAVALKDDKSITQWRMNEAHFMLSSYNGVCWMYRNCNSLIVQHCFHSNIHPNTVLFDFVNSLATTWRQSCSRRLWPFRRWTKI